MPNSTLHNMYLVSTRIVPIPSKCHGTLENKWFNVFVLSV